MADLFRLSDERWAVIEPFMPRNQPGPERNDDRQVISGILHGPLTNYVSRLHEVASRASRL